MQPPLYRPDPVLSESAPCHSGDRRLNLIYDQGGARALGHILASQGRPPGFTLGGDDRGVIAQWTRSTLGIGLGSAEKK